MFYLDFVPSVQKVSVVIQLKYSIIDTCVDCLDMPQEHQKQLLNRTYLLIIALPGFRIRDKVKCYITVSQALCSFSPLFCLFFH